MRVVLRNNAIFVQGSTNTLEESWMEEFFDHHIHNTLFLDNGVLVLNNENSANQKEEFLETLSERFTKANELSSPFYSRSLKRCKTAAVRIEVPFRNNENVDVGICWDQWFPETARSLTLMGADMIFYPTAIGSEPEIGVDSASHWQRVQMGHSAANIIPVIAANRIGEEVGESCTLTFYGSSFITDHTGQKVAEASRDREEILYSEFDPLSIREHRHYWGLIRDRRPECYGEITKH